MRHIYYDSNYYRYKINRKFSDLSPLEKFSTIALVAFLFITFIGIILFALSTDVSKIPTVVSVEPYDDIPISYKECLNGDLIANYEDKYELHFSEVNYIFKVTLSDGQTHLVSTGKKHKKLEGYNCNINLEVTADILACEKAINSEEKTVAVNISADIHRGLSSSYKNRISSFSTTAEKKIAEEIVTEIKPMDTAPLKVYPFAEETSLEGREFEITYADGRKMRDKVVLSYNAETSTYQKLDGAPINVFDSFDNELTFSFYDAFCTLRTEEEPFPFEAIEITDCSLDEEYNITSLSYTVTRKDGSTENYMGDLLHISYFDCYIFGTLDGYEIMAERSILYPKLFGDIEAEITVHLGFITDTPLTDTYKAELPSSDCSCICHRNMAYSKLFYRMYYFIQDTFSLDKTCKCGITHRYIEWN